ncbi:MAG: hypothetical protein IKV43_00975, partial [Clostridia bacterium]|nr:hypothetical protein [Clostridia bacterium]
IISTILSTIVDFMLPMVFAAVVLVRSTEKRTGALLVTILCLSLPRMAYYAPYFYMDIFTRSQIDVSEAVTLAVVFALFAALAFGVFVLILYAISRSAYKRQCKKYKKKLVPSLADMLKDGAVFDYSHARVRLLAPSLIFAFIINLPVYDTVIFFINYSDTFVFSEILSICLEVLFLLGVFAFTQFVNAKFVGALMEE